MPVGREPKTKDEERVFNVLNKIDAIAHKYGVFPFVVGGFCRNEYLRIPHTVESDIDMMAQNYDGLVLAGLIASELNIPIEFSHKSGTAKLHIDGIKVDLKANIKDYDFLQFMRKKDLPQNNLTFDIISRDFTINTLAIGLTSWHLYDILGVGKKDLKDKILKTPIESEYSIRHSPLIFLRALKFAIRDGFKISEELDKAMLNNKEVIHELPKEETLDNLKEYFELNKSKAKELYHRYGIIEGIFMKK